MDFILRCNNNQGHCRVELKEQAVATTCSHIFCHRCADQLGLTRATAQERTCPACGTDLPNVDDAVATMLQPTEEYKTSVLSGLDATTIMECAGRALAFWSYQTAQEVKYQEHINKSLAVKYSSPSMTVDNIITEANTEITTLQKQLDELTVEQNTLRQKNTELVDMYREKTKKHLQTQQLYDTLKKRVLMAQGRTSTDATPTHATHSMGAVLSPEHHIRTFKSPITNSQGRPTSHIPVDRDGVEQLHSHQRSGSGTSNRADVAAMPPPQMSRSAYRPQDVDAAAPTTTHRQPLLSVRATANRSQIPMSISRNINPRPVVAAHRRQFGMEGDRQSRGGVHGQGTAGVVRVGDAVGEGNGDTNPSVGAYAGEKR